MAEEVVPIDSFEVLAAGAEKFVTGWEKTRYCVPAQPGSIDTALHQAVSAGAEFEA